MRRLVPAVAFLCLLPVDAWGFESFYVPVIPHGSVREEIAGVPVHFEWNTAASVPTVNGIQPVDLATSPVVLSRAGSTTEVEASAAEFIDAHPDWFRVSSRNLDFRPHKAFGGTAWIVNSSLLHQGVLVLGGYAKLVATPDGGLLSLEARLFPEADLEGLSTGTQVSAERALEIALASQDYLVSIHTSAPRKVIAFRATAPFMAWQIELGDTRTTDLRPLGPSWLYFIDGTTGEILVVIDQTDSSETRAFIRGDANGDKTINIADPVTILSTLFLGATGLSCPDAADVNDDGSLDVTDGIYGLSYLFLGGPPPPKPFPNPGPDITSDSFICLFGE